MQGGGGELLLVGLLVGLLIGELVLCRQQDCTLFYDGIKGENITLSPKVSVNLTEIIWKRNETNKVAEWDGKLRLYPQLENRAEIDPSSGNLTIWNISHKDGGNYLAEPLIGGEFKPTSVCLKVLEPPAAPNLTCIIGNDGIHINCMTQYELHVTFHWKYIDMKDISKGNETEERSSIKLPSNTDQSRNITCIIEASKSTVKNSISLSTCASRRAPSQERTRNILIVVAIIIIGLIGGVCFLWRKKVYGPQAQTKSPCTEDPENEIGQGREENPLNDRSMSSHGQMFELENKKMPCSEEDPEKHIDGSEPTYRLMSETENKKTSSREDLSDKPPNECTPLCAADSEATKASDPEDLSDKPSDECIPLSNSEATAN